VASAVRTTDRPAWTFLTNHAHVLLAIARNPDVTVRELASAVGITERAIQRIILELEVAGHLAHVRVGRRNHYRVYRNRRLRHPMEHETRVGELLDLLTGGAA